MAPVTAVAAPAAVVQIDCHHDGGQDRQTPIDPQSKHVCMGCAVPAHRVDLAVPAPVTPAAAFSHAAWWLAGNVGAVDPPPPRAEG